MGDPVHGDLVLVHAFEHGALCPRRGAVDLVTHHQVGEHRARLELELPALLVVDLTPVTSLGSRSGVNWMRRTEQSIDRASALASIVLPTPGTSSISRCPSASSTARANRTVTVLPMITCSIFATIVLALRANSSALIVPGSNSSPFSSPYSSAFIETSRWPEPC